MPASGPLDFLIALAKGDRASAGRILDEADFDAAELSRITRQNQLAGFVSAHLGDLGEHPLFTGELLNLLARYHAWQVKISHRARGDLAELVELLEGHDCGVIALKGLYLASRFYGGYDQRTFWDIDLLTRDADFDRARQALEQAGFRRLSRTLFGTRLSRRFVHGFDYQRDRCKVDLHWVLASHPAVRLDYEGLWRDAPTAEVAGVAVRVLPDDLMITAHLLSAFEDVQRGSLRLRSLVDLYKILGMLESETDWNRFLDDRAEEGLRKISTSMLDLFLTVFDASSEFPALAAAIAGETESTDGPDENATALLTNSTLALANKRWAAGQYEMSRARLFGWWLVSLPFRVTVYQSDKLRRRLRSFGSRFSWSGGAT